MYNNGYDGITDYYKTMMQYIMNNKMTKIGNEQSDLNILNIVRSKIDPDIVDLRKDLLNKLEFWQRWCHFHLIKDVICKCIDGKSQVIKSLFDTDNFNGDELFRDKYNNLMLMVQEYNKYHLQSKNINKLTEYLNKMDIDVPDDMDENLPSGMDENWKENNFEVGKEEEIDIIGCHKNNDKHDCSSFGADDCGYDEEERDDNVMMDATKDVNRNKGDKVRKNKKLSDFYEKKGKKYYCNVVGCIREGEAFNAYTTMSQHIKLHHLGKQHKTYRKRRKLNIFYKKVGDSKHVICNKCGKKYAYMQLWMKLCFNKGCKKRSS